MARRRSLRSNLYAAARLLGDVQAAQKGPAAFERRMIRRRVYRATNGLTRRVLRGFGL